MDKSKFINIKKTGRTPQFKELVGLRTEDDKDLLRAFVLLMHPSLTVEIVWKSYCSCEVYTIKGMYIYTLYEKHILRTIPGELLGRSMTRKLFTYA